MPDFTIPTRPWIALLLGALNTGLAFVVGAKTADSGLPPVAVFYLACALAVLGWVLLHIVPSKATAKPAFTTSFTTNSNTVLDVPPKGPAVPPPAPEPPAAPSAAPEAPQA